MHRTTFRALAFLIAFYSCAYVFARVAAVYFYVTEFQSFVQDEVMFAPVREHADETHLFERIRDAAGYYNLKIDRPADIKIRRSITIPGMTWTTLGVDVKYTALVDLSLYKQPLHFHTAASVDY